MLPVLCVADVSNYVRGGRASKKPRDCNAAMPAVLKSAVCTSKPWSGESRLLAEYWYWSCRGGVRIPQGEHAVTRPSVCSCLPEPLTFEKNYINWCLVLKNDFQIRNAFYIYVQCCHKFTSAVNTTCYVQKRALLPFIRQTYPENSPSARLHRCQSQSSMLS